MKKKLNCDRCGKVIEKYPSQIKRHNFCSRVCLSEFSNRQKNPEGYNSLKDYSNMSKHMTALNMELNPVRMDFPTRAKLSMAMRKNGNGRTYAKSFGKHIHRRVAERELGRRLLPGEVVHHIDGNKRNNGSLNLKVFRSQAEHAKWHKEYEKGGGILDIQGARLPKPLH